MKEFLSPEGNFAGKISIFRMLGLFERSSEIFYQEDLTILLPGTNWGYYTW